MTSGAPTQASDSDVTPHGAPPTVVPTHHEITQITYQPDETTPREKTSADAPKLVPTPNFWETRGGSTEDDNSTSTLDSESTDDESAIT